MNPFALAGLVAGLLLSMIGSASAQSYDGAPAHAIASLTAPDPTIVGASIRDEDITGPADTELGTVANGAGLCRTASANPIGDIRVCRSKHEGPPRRLVSRPLKSRFKD
jgi:hypothetical protein